MCTVCWYPFVPFPLHHPLLLTWSIPPEYLLISTFSTKRTLQYGVSVAHGGHEISSAPSRFPNVGREIRAPISLAMVPQGGKAESPSRDCIYFLNSPPFPSSAGFVSSFFSSLHPSQSLPVSPYLDRPFFTMGVGNIISKLKPSAEAKDSSQFSSQAATPARADSTVEKNDGLIDDSPVKYLTWRSFILGLCVSMGGFIFGYSTGMVSQP